MKVKLCVLIIIVGIMSACKSDLDLQKKIDRAVNADQSEIIIPAGRYEIDKTIFLDGVENLIIRTKNPGDVIITSGMEIPLAEFTCLDEKKGIYEITLPELISDPWPDAFRGYAGWPEVYVSGYPLHLARWPNKAYTKIDSVIRKGSIPRNDDSTNQGGIFTSDLHSEFSILQSPLYLSGYWCYKWFDEVIRVESVDYETGEVKMASPHRYGIGGPSGGLFYAINVPEILDVPDEYYFDGETGTIRMILPENVHDNPIIQIGYKDFTLIDIQNCRNIRIEGIKFTNHNGLAVQITNSDSVVIQSCDLNRLAQSAVEISGGMNCGVTDSEISYIGATGVRLEGGDRESLTPVKHFVTKSTIHDFARHIKTYAPAVNLLGVGHIVSQNKIADAPHNAILFSGNDHLIERNDIRRVCWDTSDAGAIYCGRDWTMGGTVIQYNSFFNLGQASHHHNWAIYLDDLASGIDVLNNYINDCPSGILVGGGRYNRIIGNEITDCPKASIMYDARGLNWYIPYIEDPDNELWQRLWAMPIDKSPWKDRFPWLMDIPDDEPGVPKYVTILDNVIIKSADPAIHSAVNEFGDVRFDKPQKTRSNR